MNQVSVSGILSQRWVSCVLIFSLLVSYGIRRSSIYSPPPDFLADQPLLLQSTADVPTDMQYDFYRETCPEADEIIRRKMADLYSQRPDVFAGLLRLMFHDCFIQGCDASVFLDESGGNSSHLTEKQAIPNQTLRGFDAIEDIKSEIENSCPAVVSCADTLVLATREGIRLAGGPFYPVFTGRKDSVQSYFFEALAEIPSPNDNITRILDLFGRRGFTTRETVSLLGSHNIGKMGCQFVVNRLHNFSGTGQPDPTMATDFLTELRRNCGNESQGLNSSISSGAGFDTHYYQSLMRGRGLLHADQQLTADPRTSILVEAYASDDGTTFRVDFARAMMKMSSLSTLTQSQGMIRRNCSSLAV